MSGSGARDPAVRCADIEVTLDDVSDARRKRFLESLYRQYSAVLLRFISRRNVSRDEAQEIVQETYYRMHQVPQIETLESPRGYLFRTAINLAHDTHRQQRKTFPLARESEDGSLALEVPSEEPNAYRVLNAEQEVAILRKALGELHPTCRRVFVLHRFENATYPQIATQLGISVSMIEKHISRALAHLKKRLDQAHSR